jgi:opacity protein-like surface antigen
MRLFLLGVAGVLLSGTAVAQRELSQTDVAVSVYGAFSGSTNGNGVQQSPSNGAGFLAELHHQSNPLVGYELTYAWNRASQTYSANVACPAGTSPGQGCIGVASKFVPADAHEVTADWQVGFHIVNLRPFALAGAGLIFNDPTSGSGTQTQAKPVFVYGAGLDYGVLPHLGFRFQYRGNVYKAPQLATAFSSTGRFTQTAEPMIGAYLRF